MSRGCSVIPCSISVWRIHEIVLFREKTAKRRYFRVSVYCTMVNWLPCLCNFSNRHVFIHFIYQIQTFHSSNFLGICRIYKQTAGRYFLFFRIIFQLHTNIYRSHLTFLDLLTSYLQLCIYCSPSKTYFRLLSGVPL